LRFRDSAKNQHLPPSVGCPAPDIFLSHTMTFPATSQSAQPASVLPQPTVVRREDYREPDWLAEGLVLHFALDAQDTVVTAVCRYRRRPGAAADARAVAGTGGADAVPTTGPRTPGEEYTAWSPAGVRPLEILNRAGTDPEAKKVLVEVATTICQVEAPIARRRLYVKISRAFGLSRTVKSREESIRTALGEAFAYFDEDGFVWTSREAALAAPTYRRNALDHVDSIQEIHPRELVGLMAQARAKNPEWASREDLFTWALKRLSARNRSLGARGVSEVLTRALKEAEREQP